MPLEDPLLVKFQTVADEVAINNQLLLLVESDSEEALNDGRKNYYPNLASILMFHTPSRLLPENGLKKTWLG